jgi:hypothetical protein
MLDIPPRLELPITGQALRQAVESRDIPRLHAVAAQLRVAGYRGDPQSLVNQLLNHGCAWITDAFDHAVPVQVRVPPALPRHQVDERVPFRIAD